MPHRKGFEKLIREYLPYGQHFEGIEIGCWQGQFDNYLLGIFENLNLITIDAHFQWADILGNNLDHLSRLCILPFPADVAFNLMCPVQARYDFVFIDGDHSYEQCKKDILNFSQFVREGGLVAGHNYHKAPNSAHPGVYQAVDEIYKDKVRLEEDFIWYVQV